MLNKKMNKNVFIIKNFFKKINNFFINNNRRNVKGKKWVQIHRHFQISFCNEEIRIAQYAHSLISSSTFMEYAEVYYFYMYLTRIDFENDF